MYSLVLIGLKYIKTIRSNIKPNLYRAISDSHSYTEVGLGGLFLQFFFYLIPINLPIISYQLFSRKNLGETFNGYVLKHEWHLYNYIHFSVVSCVHVKQKENTHSDAAEEGWTAIEPFEQLVTSCYDTIIIHWSYALIPKCPVLEPLSSFSRDSLFLPHYFKQVLCHQSRQPIKSYSEG